MKTRIIFALTIAIANNTFAQQVLYCSGTVCYPSGAPAPGVRVAFYSGFYRGAGDYAEVKTDGSGRYEIIQPKKSFAFMVGPIILTNSVMARDAERNLAAFCAFNRTTSNIDLTLQPAVTLSGSVKNTEGLPVGGAVVEIRFNSGESLPLLFEQPITANEQGQFSIPALPQGVPYVIWGVRAKGYGSGSAHIAADNPPTNRYDFPMVVLKHADRKLAGQVLDINGKPLAGAELKFYSDNGPDQPKDLVAKSDSEGNFVFDEVCDGKVMISSVWTDPATKLFSQIGEVRSIQADDTNIVIRLHAFNR